MRILNKKYLLLGIILFLISIVFVGILWDAKNTGKVWFGILAFLFLVTTVDYIINPDIKADEIGIKSYHKRIPWCEIKYIDKYPYLDRYSRIYLEELLEEIYSIDINKINAQELENYKKEYTNSYQGIYVGFGDEEESRFDLYLNLSDNKRIEIINKLNDMLSQYK